MRGHWQLCVAVWRDIMSVVVAMSAPVIAEDDPSYSCLWPGKGSVPVP